MRFHEKSKNDFKNFLFVYFCYNILEKDELVISISAKNWEFSQLTGIFVY